MCSMWVMVSICCLLFDSWVFGKLWCLVRIGNVLCIWFID